MAQTLRINFTYQAHSRQLPSPRTELMAPLSLTSLMQQLQQYVTAAKNDLLQPRQEVLDRILQHV